MLNDTFTQTSNTLIDSIISNSSFCMRSRILYFILRMTSGYHRDSVKLSRSEIAQAIGYSGALPNISRCLTWLKAKGFISKQGKSITLLKQSTSEPENVSSDAQKKVSNDTFQNVSNDAQIDTHESYPQDKTSINSDSVHNKKSINGDIKNTQKVSMVIPTSKEILNKKLTTSEIDKSIKFCSEQDEEVDADKIKYEYSLFANYNRDNTKINSHAKAQDLFKGWLNQMIGYKRKGEQMRQRMKTQAENKKVSIRARFFDSPQPTEKNVSPDAPQAAQQNVSTNNRFISSNASRIANDFAEFMK